MAEHYPDTEPSPAAVFETLVAEVLGLCDEIVAMAIGPVSYARVTEIRAQQNLLQQAVPELLIQDMVQAVDDFTQGKPMDEILQSFAVDPAMDAAVRLETALEYIMRASLSGMTVGKDEWGVFLQTEREHLPLRPGLAHTRFSRLRVHEGSIVQENYEEAGRLPPAGSARNEYRRRKIEAERAEATNGMPIPDEQAVHLTGQLAVLKQQLIVLQNSGVSNIQEYLR